MVLLRALKLLLSDWRLFLQRMSKRLKIFNLQALFQLKVDSLLMKNDKIIVVDCGANIGQSVTLFRKVFGQSIMVHCYEPNPECFNVLNKLHGTDRLVSLYQSGISDQNTHAAFFISKNNPLSQGGSMIFNYTDMRQFDVDITAISDVIKRASQSGAKIIIKIDIEGAEFKLLEMLPDLLERYEVKICYIEFHAHKFPLSERQKYYHQIRNFKSKVKNINCRLRVWK